MKGMQKINADFYVDKTKKLGQGNFGVVFKGYMLSENKIIAVKYMTKQQLNKNPDYQRQITVMQDLSKINHPNIMGYYGYEMTKDGLYCFIEFCGGGSLKQLAKKKISQVKTMTLIKQMFEAMSYINDLNKVHRDLKPDNILLDENLDLKIADFGLARDVQVTMTKGACTPLFAAPEVFNLEQYDQKCDVWSAGLILYEMLTGRQMFADIKTKNQLKQQLLKFKGGNRKIVYPKQLHKNWTLLTEKMLTFDKTKRPSFKQLLKYFQEIKGQMQADLNAKYGFDESNQGDIRSSKMRAEVINPYKSRHTKEKNDPQLKLLEQQSYKKYSNAQKYLIFFRMKTDFMCKIIKAFTSNSYAILKNVYKYILMFLSVSCYISKLSESLVDLKNKQVNTPDGLIELKDIAQTHIRQWEQLIDEFKKKHAVNIERFRQVLQKQIVQKITKSYLNRDEQKKILSSYKNLLTWIEQTTKGNFMKHKYYSEMFVQIINEESTYCTEPQLKAMELNDVKTYAYIRLTGYLDDFLPDKQYKNEDFIRIRRQELQNMGKSQLIEFIKKFNSK